MHAEVGVVAGAGSRGGRGAGRRQSTVRREAAGGWQQKADGCRRPGAGVAGSRRPGTGAGAGSRRRRREQMCGWDCAPHRTGKVPADEEQLHQHDRHKEGDFPVPYPPVNLRPVCRISLALLIIRLQRDAIHHDRRCFRRLVRVDHRVDELPVGGEGVRLGPEFGAGAGPGCGGVVVVRSIRSGGASGVFEAMWFDTGEAGEHCAGEHRAGERRVRVSTAWAAR